MPRASLATVALCVFVTSALRAQGSPSPNPEPAKPYVPAGLEAGTTRPIDAIQRLEQPMKQATTDASRPTARSVVASALRSTGGTILGGFVGAYIPAITTGSGPLALVGFAGGTLAGAKIGAQLGPRESVPWRTALLGNAAGAVVGLGVYAVDTNPDSYAPFLAHVFVAGIVTGLITALDSGVRS